MGQRKKNYKRKKPYFHGNRHTNGQNGVDTSTVEEEENRSAVVEESEAAPLLASSAPCASKVKLQLPEDMELDSDNELTGFRFIDCELLVNFVSSLLCPDCKRPLGASRLSSCKEERTDLASKFIFECGCQNKVSFFTSKKCHKVYEVNRRFPLAVFAIGRHQAQGKRLLGNMNIPCSLNNTTWANHKKQICKATEAVASQSKVQAAQEVRVAAGGDDVTVSGDGTYQRRGFQSKNGVVTMLSVNGRNSKVIDTEVLSNHCDSCKKQEKKKQGQELEQWRVVHEGRGECMKNHDGSAAAMEPAGAEAIFRRSEELHGLRYVNFLGDGDSKTYTNLKNADPEIYDNIHIEKLECCGHVQKRMGRQLTNKVAELKSKSFVHNGKTVKGIGGKGKLTKPAILRIQGHFGAAIRKNTGNLPQMKQDIWAIWEHRHGEHRNCGNWCPSKKGAGDPDKNRLPDFVCDAIRPVFQTLTQDSLLQRCLHGGTQNTNESFHNIIWELCPKTIFVGRRRLCLAVADATILYNDGNCGRLDIFRRLGMQVGHYTSLCFRELDRNRVEAAQIQATEAAQFVRRQRALEAAARQDINVEEYYQAGAHE